MARPLLFSHVIRDSVPKIPPFSSCSVGLLLPPQAALASFCSAFLVDSCYVVACFSSHTAMGRIPYVSPEL